LSTIVDIQPTSESQLRPLTQLRVSLLDLYERQGWKSLGYDSWKACVTNEFKDKQRYLYYQLEAAKTERNLQDLQNSTKVEIGSIPERQLRPLSNLSPDQQREIWKKAVETAPEGKSASKIYLMVNGCNG